MLSASAKPSLAGLLRASALVLGVLLAGCERAPSVIKIGVAQPLSGNLAPLGQDMLNGVKLAVDEINKQGYKLNGKAVQLEVLAVDDRSDPETGKRVAQQLVDEGVVAVIGHLNSGVSIAAAPIYAAAGLAELAISTNPKFTQLGFPTTFRLVGNDVLQAKAIGSFASGQLSGSNFAIIDDATPYGKGLAEGAMAELKAANKTVGVRQTFDDKTVAFDDLATKLQSAKVDVLVAVINDFQMLALLQALKKVGYTDLSILGADLVKTTTMLKGSDTVQAFYATTPVLDATEFVAGAKFLDSYRTAFKMEPTYGGHYSYDAMYVLSSAIRRAGSTKPDAIVRELHRIDAYAPVTGSMRFDPQGEQRYGVIGIYAMRKGKWELQVRSDRW